MNGAICLKKKRVIKIINIVLVAVFVIAAFNIGKIYYDYNKADKTYENIQDEYVAANKELFVPEQTESNIPEPTNPPEPPITVDFDSLLERNKDVLGWLYCPNTVINYPVVQGKNNDQYLHRDLDGKYLVSGTLFSDYRNGTLDEDTNYIIYGHNMKNGTMFNILTKYKQQAYYDQHPVIYYLTPDGNYKLELFAGLVVKRNDRIYDPKLDEEEFTTLLNDYRAKSTFKADVELEYNDTIVTLSTCSYEFDNARYIVMGRLIAI